MNLGFELVVHLRPLRERFRGKRGYGVSNTSLAGRKR